VLTVYSAHQQQCRNYLVKNHTEQMLFM